MKVSKKVLALFFLFITSCLYADELGDFISSLWEYESTGYSVNSEASLCSIGGPSLVTSVMWTNNWVPSRVYYELFFDKRGRLDFKDFGVSYFYEDESFTPNFIEEITRTDIVRPDILNVNVEEVVSSDSDKVTIPTVSSFMRLENISKLRLESSMGELVFFAYGDEITGSQITENNKIVVISHKGKLIRKTYDNKMRLICKERFNYSGTISGATINTTQKFVYEDGNTPVYSTVTGIKDKHEVFYDEKGRVIKDLYYTKENEYVLQGTTFWKYNIDDKLMEKTSETYQYKIVKRRRVTTKSSKKERYEYKVSDSKPDYYYYEDDTLRMQTVYSSESSYIQTMYFDAGFKVESFYINEKHTKDLYYQNGILRRQQIYEK